MLATDEMILLQEFLDEDVVCEMVETDAHSAHIYVQFSCPNCAWSRVWAACNPCWKAYTDQITPKSILLCSNCKKTCPSKHVVNLGPVR